MQLIGSQVLEAKVSENAALSLRFSDGAVLRVQPDPSYESYRITQAGREFIV
jgi:hypothetical protein